MVRYSFINAVRLSQFIGVTFRQPRGSTFKAVNDWKYSPKELSPHVVVAVLKCQATAPPEKVFNKVCKYVTTSEITQLGHRVHDVGEGELMLRSFRGIVRAEPSIRNQTATKFFGHLDVATARHLLLKSQKEDFKTLQDIAIHYHKALGVILGKPMITDTASPSSKALPNLLQYDSTGQAMGAQRLQLQNLGFVEGSAVKLEKGSEIGIVRAISMDGTVVVCRSSSVGIEEGKEFSYDKFLATYTKTKSEIENVVDWHDNSPMNTETHMETLSKCRIQLAMGILATKHSFPDLRIQMKPHKAVFVEANVGIGKLVLVPETTRITVGKSNVDDPVGGWQFRATVADTPFSVFFLQCTFSKTFAVPVWLLKTTEVENEANMELCTKSVAKVTSIWGLSNESGIDISVLVNKVALKKGNELIVYREAAPVKPKSLKRHMAFQDGPGTGMPGWKKVGDYEKKNNW